MNLSEALTSIKWNADGLIPAVTQDANTGDVLMLAWMNEESLKITLKTGKVTYFSRSRRSLWEKGATSGNRQRLISMSIDCDGDTLLIKAEQTGPACHTGNKTCFFTEIRFEGENDHA